ncbi:glycine dehydrogenase-like protein [Thermochaetoides thermophila DSM 1495]|uniref:Glycine cleavage system P protein n=1 Tax=Chaetomium thermophilum (strain DSM 1495 / CBS 144.50 / IMI 039719) TaxID=759272 RepID=G0S0R1_CHATD|nr:glycine dehydrogenase-like protein [Thermochaetoides thermophila DSM 1495]EGS22621.1 glycine dehydrogenase-like protein [Thermochaetoides thermophila DSM 1495]
MASRQIGRLGPKLGASALVVRGTSPLNLPLTLRAAAVTVNATTTRCYAKAPKPRPSTEPKQPEGIRLAMRARLFRSHEKFVDRHIGPNDENIQEMLKTLDPPVESLDEFVKQVIPADILTQRELFHDHHNYYSAQKYGVKEGLEEYEVQDLAKNMAWRNGILGKNMIGMGYYEARTPEVIKRNVFENPAWYTSYTPYQPEISQGRLESLLNFQTMVSDLTSLPVANASLLDEGTAAAEALTMSLNTLPTTRAKRPGRTYVVDENVHPQTINVLRSRAEGFGVNVVLKDLSKGDYSDIEALGEDLVGVLVQYPDTYGNVSDYKVLAEVVHKQGALLAAATDLLALTLLTPPGEWGADIALGNSQRFGIPLGFGGPHAAFFAVQEKYKRKMPGRLVGVSKDRTGRRALRLALQTREQHIRREKATSNVCTAQALLANMSAFYAIYHGPEGLKRIAEKCNLGARVLQAAAKHFGLVPADAPPVAFDTLAIKMKDTDASMKLNLICSKRRINARVAEGNLWCISVDEATRELDLLRVIQSFDEFVNGCPENDREANSTQCHQLLTRFIAEEKAKPTSVDRLSPGFKRQSPYLTHPVFNLYHSETELTRYIYHLQSKDLSLVHSMIPLGSCTMKLNGATEMSLISHDHWLRVHPYTFFSYTHGYDGLITGLKNQLKIITGMDGVSLQPNSGAQGEFAGLRTIRKFHESRGEGHRDICLIPVSAHGTNPASAAMAGMRVVPIKCDTKTGNLDLADLEAKCEKHADELAAIMITYPSTYGVFEPNIKKVCEIVHKYGGQVYMDGANMNAQIGLCSPGEIGADVCHLNLHKTFCIPHGGGGPGVGPICVKSHLIKHLPARKPAYVKDTTNWPVASAPHGSAAILPIPWAYNTLMGGDGLKKATQVTLLNANYMLSRLKPHYSILYTNEHGRCAHEFILDARPFQESAGIEAIDIAKRLQDYGFHAPTMSWPVPGTLMIEPTESESKEELDRFCDALISIREEIREIEEGKQPRDRNVLKLAPHPMQDLIDGDGEGKWDRPYSREKAAYPLPWLREKKFWPSVARLDDTYGDLNLFCTCPPVQDTTQE